MNIGKGRKQCPSCEKIIGARSHECSCGHVFKAVAASSVNIFDGPGQGRKQCPKCQKYVGAITKICQCGNDFSVNKKVVKSAAVINIFDEPGQGRKQCPKCQKYVGAKVKICQCGNDFNANPSLKKVVVQEEKVVNTFDEPGQGRKQCPKCQKYVGAKVKICQCGNNFRINPPIKKVIVQKEEEEEKEKEKVINTYTEGGCGRKQCPICRQFVGIRASECACGHEFVKVEVQKEVQTYSKGGCGRKECPVCKKYVGAPNRICACGHVFEAAEKKLADKFSIPDLPPTAYTSIVDSGGARIKINTPSWKCPVLLKSSEEDAVQDWAQELREIFKKDDRWLTVEALKYFVRHSFDMNEERNNHQTVCNILDNLYGGELVVNSSRIEEQEEESND